MFAPSQLLQLALGEGFDGGRGNLQSAHDIVVKNTDSSRGDGSDSQLRLFGCTQLPNNENIKRQAEATGYLVTDRNPTARQRQHDGIVASGIFLQQSSESISPGPAIANLATLSPLVLLFVAAMIAGMAAHDLWRRRQQSAALLAGADG